jgi:hypothetical protein
MELSKDTVSVPLVHLPRDIVREIITENPRIKETDSWEFHTADLDHEYYDYYIDSFGRLVLKETRMSVDVVEGEGGRNITRFVIDVDHIWVTDAELETIYSDINGKLCILAVSFNGGILSGVDSIM